MRICYVADGGSIHTQRWVNYFARKGHEVHLICWRLMPGYDENTHIHLLTRLPPKRWTKYISALLWIFQTRRLVRKIKPDIVDGHFVISYGFLAACSGFHPLVISAWGSDVLAAPKKWRLAKLDVKFVLRKADMVTAQNEDMGEHLKSDFKLPQSKFTRISWGVDLGVFHRGYQEDVIKFKKDLKINENSPIILSHRSMAPQYEIASIIEAVPHVVPKCPTAMFVFLRGSGTERFEDEMKSRAEQLKITDKIRFIPKLIPPKEMAVYLNMADAFISIPKYGQFGISVLEGMACGATPILSNIAVHRELVVNDESAFLVDPENPEEIAQKIIYCIEHPELKDKFYRINKRMVEEKENWDKNARERERLYERLVSGKDES